MLLLCISHQYFISAYCDVITVFVSYLFIILPESLSMKLPVFLPIGAGTMWIFVSLITTAQSNGDSILLGLSFGERYQPGHGNS